VPAAGIPGIKQLELSSGLALCVRGTVKDAFFTRFRGGYSPDRFSNKGVLAALLDSGETRPYAILTTHFHDYSNDAFGGARRNNLQALASVVRWIDENWAVPIVVTGDFNIDARQAHEQEPSIETVLYKELVILRKPPGHWWLDVNATVNAPMPKRTQREGERAIDYILLSEPKLASQLSFDCASCGSDHQLVTSSWISA
jgi:endonuclease/exonuclease/phosphatase family metal-dependent hydrolase